VIVEALRKNQRIVFNYITLKYTTPQARQVEPWQLLFDSGLWYLSGRDVDKAAVRIFSLSRISGARPRPEHFTLPPDFDYEGSSLAGQGSYFGVYAGQDREQYRIRCYGAATARAQERLWAADQRFEPLAGDPAAVYFCFSSTQAGKVLEWVLSCGGAAVPEAPAWLVDEWRENIQDMAANAGLAL
jgi:hypothetical protein